MVPSDALQAICEAFGISPVRHDRLPHGQGLINHTYLLKDRNGENDWILQQVNTAVFTRPELIAWNNYLAAEHLRSHHPDYPFMRGRPTVHGKDLFHHPEHGTWRMFPYFRGTVSHDAAGSRNQARSAARQFGRLVRCLDGVYVAPSRRSFPASTTWPHGSRPSMPAFRRPRPADAKKPPGPSISSWTRPTS
jgi:hypothetical protein